MTDATIGIDVGGTKILGVLADPSTGVVHDQVQIATPTGRGDTTRSSPGSRLAQAITEVIGQLFERGANPPAIGVGLPGLVDLSGVLRYGPNVPGVRWLDVASGLRSRFGVPVVVENDATNAARAEHSFGVAKGISDAIVITQGTGIGGALIVNGQIVRGANGFAGEPGHMQVNADGYRCACGRDGCWETVSSGAGLINLARSLVVGGNGGHILELAGGEVNHIRGEHVATALAEGDREAIELVEEFASWVAVGLGGLISILDPAIIVLGGGLTSFGEHFLADVRTKLPARTMGGEFRPQVPVVAAELGPAAGAIGGAIHASEVL